MELQPPDLQGSGILTKVLETDSRTRLARYNKFPIARVAVLTKATPLGSLYPLNPPSPPISNHHYSRSQDASKSASRAHLIQIE